MGRKRLLVGPRLQQHELVWALDVLEHFELLTPRLLSYTGAEGGVGRYHLLPLAGQRFQSNYLS